jgi:hypothetical protein
MQWMTRLVVTFIEQIFLVFIIYYQCLFSTSQRWRIVAFSHFYTEKKSSAFSCIDMTKKPNFFLFCLKPYFY